MSIRRQGDQEALNERANNLDQNGFNGIKLIVVNIPSTDPNPPEANLEVHFFNNNKLVDILNDPHSPDSIFSILGGRRILGGHGLSQVKVIRILGVNIANNILDLAVAPIGDYSTYTLNLNYANIDPVFSEIEFKFRPGCFTNNCSPEWEPAERRQYDPPIDYLAKDFDSFRHAMIVAMMERVPGWQPTSEADLDQVLLELISASGDELSDYQDRVVNEAYLITARKRVSLANHARLMDYHIHQGNQASSWIALKLQEGVMAEYELDPGFQIMTESDEESTSVAFITKETGHFHQLFNALELYTWQDSIVTLRAGATSADLKSSGELSAKNIQDLIRNKQIGHLLIQEWRDPDTGREEIKNPNKRQLLRLLNGDSGAEAMHDPITGEWFVRIKWEPRDMLRYNYCFTTRTSDGKKVERVSLFHGNLVRAYSGRRVKNIFKEGLESAYVNAEGLYVCSIERGKYINNNDISDSVSILHSQGAACRLPKGPLLYEKTLLGGEIPPKSTLSVEVIADDTVIPTRPNLWTEVISFIHSTDSDENFIVETDEEGMSLLRFGNGTNGKKLPDKVQVHCTYQIGQALAGNLGSDKLTKFDKFLFPNIDYCWNPFDVTDAIDREPVAEIVRNAPEAYKSRQLRAITLQDYVNLVEKIEGVSRASAHYLWTGSWRTVQIAIDPAGTTELSDKIRKDIAQSLQAVKLIGEDFEIRPARYVPLEIHVILCVHENYWIGDIRSIIEQEFSSGYKADGTMAFFHPDRWTFGHQLSSSHIIGCLQAIEGVDYVIKVEMKRWNESTPGTAEEIVLQLYEIIQVENDPDYMEKGFIDFVLKGGRG